MCGGIQFTVIFFLGLSVEPRQQSRINFRLGCFMVCGMGASRGEGIEGLGNSIARELVQRSRLDKKGNQDGKSLIIRQNSAGWENLL